MTAPGPHVGRTGLDSRVVPTTTSTQRAGTPGGAADAGSAGSAGAVVVSGLVKHYGSRAAVTGLDLVAPAGAITALLGPNGAGKTTTVECCEGLRRPDGGTVRVLGLDPVRDARRLRPRVGVMLQDGGLPSTVPAGEALRHLAAMYARPRDLGELSERLGLTAFARTQVRRLSGGQRQRLALAAAVVGRPEVVFLDEPSAGMDPQARLAVWELVRELRAQGVTIVLTTHQMAEAEALADHVVVVDRGAVLAAGTTAHIVGDAGAIRITLRPPDGASSTRSDEAHAASLSASLAARLLGGDGPGVTTTATAGVLEVRAAADPDLLHEITGWAVREDVLLASVTCGRRTLEDVFIEI